MEHRCSQASRSSRGRPASGRRSSLRAAGARAAAAPAARLSADPRHLACAWRRPWRSGSPSSAPTCAATATAASRPPIRRIAAYAKRAMAQDMVEVMAALGHERFLLAGHDRGGRVAHRLCLDHPERVPARGGARHRADRARCSRATNQAIATGYYHWFFLIQPEPLPERMIGADPLFYLHPSSANGRRPRTRAGWTPAALAEYERCFADPATIHASCEDYRAAATIDLVRRRGGPRPPHRLSAAGAVGRAGR